MNVYESIIQGLNEAVEFEKGNVKARTANRRNKGYSSQLWHDTGYLCRGNRCISQNCRSVGSRNK